MVPEHPGDHLEDGHQGKPGHPGSAGPGPLPRCGWVQAAGGAGPAATENLGGSGREGSSDSRSIADWKGVVGLPRGLRLVVVFHHHTAGVPGGPGEVLPSLG